MNISFIIILVVSLAGSVWAQEDRTSNSDLRGSKVLFSIQVDDKNLKEYTLSRSVSGDHSFLTKYSDKVIAQKMDSERAFDLDETISAEFINLKYFMGAISKCSSFHVFKMRNEELKVCSKDKKRRVKFQELVKTIQHKI